MFRRKKTLSDISTTLPRAELLRHGRILFVDDEEPELIGDLKKEGFTVDYLPDITPDEISRLQPGRVDLLVLDFGNVGQKYGKDEGLSLLRHVKQVNPTLTVLAYTSKELPPRQAADFYDLADGSLPKDAGIRESIERIEKALRQAYSIDTLWSGLLTAIGVQAGSAEDKRLQDRLVRSYDGKKGAESFRTEVLNHVTGDAGREIVVALVTQLVKKAFGA